MPDLVAGVLAFVQARWKESGGYSLTPRLPATVEDTFHALRILSTLKALDCPDFRHDQGLRDYLTRMRQTPGMDGRTTFHLLCACRLAGVAVEQGEATRFVKSRLAETLHLSERYYCARIVREVLERPDIDDGLDRRDDLYARPWRTADELWMILYLVNGHSELNKLARRDDLVSWLQACQNYDGGFGFLPGSTSYMENCHTALRALALLHAAPRVPPLAGPLSWPARPPPAALPARMAPPPFFIPPGMPLPPWRSCCHPTHDDSPEEKWPWKENTSGSAGTSFTPGW